MKLRFSIHLKIILGLFIVCNILFFASITTQNLFLICLAFISETACVYLTFRFIIKPSVPTETPKKPIISAQENIYKNEADWKSIVEKKENSIPEHHDIRSEAILANIGDGLVVTDKAGVITIFNKAAQSMLGWTEEEALGKHLQDIVIIQYQDSLDKNNQVNPSEQITKELGENQSLFFVRKDKTVFPAALKVSSYVHGLEILGTITLFRDITIERNSDKMKNEFTSLASHQLKTPLSTIRWYIVMLIDGDAGKLLPEQLKFANNIKSATFHMIDLVNSLLNISRIDSGRIMIEPKPTDLKILINGVIQDIQPKLTERKQKVSVIYKEQIPDISIDPQLVSQIYLNLLTNASKYSPDGEEITITLSLKDNEIISEIRDHGYGIIKKDTEKIFDKFYRGENIIEKIHDGTGLGLYLVKAIIELSKGRIWFESTEGKGTTFWFTLPTKGMSAKKGVVVLDG